MRKRRAILIGVTGQIGAGKSTVSGILQTLGCELISGDDIGRLVVERSAHVRSRLAKRFGRDILLPDDKIDRAELGRRAFASESNRLALNAIVHPPLLRELSLRLRVLRKTHAVVVIDATLLIEWGLHKKVDEVVVVTAARATRHKRLASRSLSSADIRAREKLQLSQTEFKYRATKVFTNNGKFAPLRRDVASWLKSICDNHIDRRS